MAPDTDRPAAPSLHLHDVYRRGFRDGWDRPDRLAVPGDLPPVDVDQAVAAELRARARYFDTFYRQPGDPYGSALTHVVDHLIARADELDPPA